MVISNKELEGRLKRALEESKLLKYALLDIPRRSFNKDEVMKASSTLGKIEFVKDTIVLLDEEGNTVAKCPNFGVGVSADAEWVTVLIDDIDYDVDFDGEIEKAGEAVAAYSLRIVRDVLCEEVFSEEYDELVKHYDFENFCILESNSYNGPRSFRELLESWQSLQSYTINVLVSASKMKISSFKKDNALYLRDGMPRDAVEGLRKISIEVGVINSSYANGVLNPINVKDLTKLEILQHLSEKKNKINSKIESSKYCDLYRVLNLTSEYVDPITKKKLFNLANFELHKLFTVILQLQQI